MLKWVWDWIIHGKPYQREHLVIRVQRKKKDDCENHKPLMNVLYLPAKLQCSVGSTVLACSSL
jgi:hypothetical protein